MRRLILFVIVFPLVLSDSLLARTWRIKPDGSGAAPTIQAAIDSCSVGDTVLAASGSYEGDGNHDIDFKGKAIVVRSEHGRDSTSVFAVLVEGSRGFIFHSGEDSSSVVEGFSIRCDRDLIECTESSPIVRDNYLMSVMGPGLTLTSTSSRIVGNEIYCWMGGPSIHCISDSSLIAGNYVRPGSEGIPRPIICENSFNRIVGNTLRNTLSCTGGSYEIRDNHISIYQFWAAFGAAPPISAAGASAYMPSGMSAIWCSSCSALIANNYISSASITCDSATATIRGNTFKYSFRVSIHLRGGTYDIEGNTITESGYDTSGNGIICSYVDSTTTIRGNLIVDNNHTEYFNGILCGDASPRIANNIIARNGYLYCERGVGIGCAHSSPTIIGNTIVANEVWKVIDCSNQSNPIIRQNLIAQNYGVGVSVADTTCMPVVSCCDVFDNDLGNYMGIPDQTGLDGNISADPIFCDLESGEYEIHALSPCAPGHHPDGATCGLIGARGIGCDYVATLLQEYHAAAETAAIRVAWSVSEAGSGMQFSVLRAEALGGEYEALPGTAIQVGARSFEFVDGTCVSGMSYRYRVDVSDELGRRVLFETDPVSPAPPRFALYQNAPNPFNPTTTITYSLPSKGRVSLEIYDVRGARIATLEAGEQGSGTHSVVWNGIDGRGQSVASGVYFFRLTAGKETISRKMVLLR